MASSGQTCSAPSLDAVMVETDPCSQSEVVCDALDSGRHAICDVPLSYRLRDCWDVVLAVERTGLKFQMGEQLRYAEFVHEWQEMVTAGRLGKVLYVEGQYIHDIGPGREYWDPVAGTYLSAAAARDNPNAGRSDRLPIHPIAYNPHELSPILKILQDRVKTVSCVGTRRGSYTYDIPDKADLEAALKPTLLADGFQHHVRLEHPRTGEGFEYDFWRPRDGIAIEVMGYRADDEVYKDILKFHVHEGTRVGVVLVPRYKWISSRRTDTNHSATLKALAFADHAMSVDALVAIAYDWEATALTGTWRLVFSDGGM